MSKVVAMVSPDVEVLEMFRNDTHQGLLGKYKEVSEIADDLLEQANYLLDTKR